MPVSEKTFEQLALEDSEGHWELYDGEPRRKPGMTTAHNRTAIRLGHQLLSQLDWDAYDVRVNAGHVRRTERNYFIPDVMVIPMHLLALSEERDDVLETVTEPLPLIVEVWSRSTGEYDVATKLDEYRRRGDHEIWLIDPYRRTVSVWRRQADGSYRETLYTQGQIEPSSLPGVRVDLATLFSRARTA